MGGSKEKDPAGPGVTASWAARWRSAGPSEQLHLGGPSGRWLSGDELDERSASMAGGLVEQGVRPGDRVAWHASAEEHDVLAAFAVLRAGAVLVPLNPRQSELERRVLLEATAPALVLAPGVLDAVDLEGSPPLEAVDQQSGSDLALIVATSGTTGSPKGAALRHANLTSQFEMLAAAWGWSAGDRLVSALPLFHVHGLVVALFCSQALGASLVLEPSFEAGSFLEAIERSKASMAFCVPTMLHRMGAEPSVGAVDRLRLLVSGSSPLAVELFERFAARGVTILERYGMTETLLTISNPLDGERRPGAVGFPLPGVLADLPAPGEERELRIAGPTVFDGYWGQPEATAAILQDGWLSTGDIVRVDEDGYVAICGRSKELIISGGFNVYPNDVEDVLRSHQAVLDAAVVGAPSVEWGEEVVAHVVLASASDLVHLEAWAAERLSGYKVPKRWVVANEIPRNALGKIQRHLL